MKALRLLLHLSPVLPLIYGRLYLTLAFVLLVALAYIKTLKLTTRLEDLKARGADAGKVTECQRTLKFWRQLTFGNHDDS